MVTRTNHRRRLMLTVLIISLTAISCAPFPISRDELHTTYSVKRVNSSEISIDGSIEDIGWRNTKTIDGFGSPWNTTAPQATTFGARWDQINLYYFFEIYDATPATLDHVSQELEIGREDRAELFIARINVNEAGTNCKLSHYIGLEIDFDGRVLDFSAHPYRQFDFDWTPKSHVIQATRRKNHITIEGKIELRELSDLGLYDSSLNSLIVGVFRGDFVGLSDPEPTWLTWIDPKTDTPDFHICRAFGRFILD